MSKLDKLKKKIKKLEHKLDQQPTPSKKAKKEIKRFRRELEEKDQIINDLQRRLADKQNATPEPNKTILLAHNEDRSLALEYKSTWKKHRFLCERYDVHLDSGQEKNRARTMANKDLVERYGTKAGFTKEQLCDILS